MTNTKPDLRSVQFLPVLLLLWVFALAKSCPASTSAESGAAASLPQQPFQASWQQTAGGTLEMKWGYHFSFLLPAGYDKPGPAATAMDSAVGNLKDAGIRVLHSQVVRRSFSSDGKVYAKHSYLIEIMAENPMAYYSAMIQGKESAGFSSLRETEASRKDAVSRLQKARMPVVGSVLSWDQANKAGFFILYFLGPSKQPAPKSIADIMARAKDVTGSAADLSRIMK